MKHIIFSFTFLAATLLFFPLQAQQKNEKIISEAAKKELVTYINQLKKDPALTSAVWSIRIVNPSNNDLVISYNENTSLLPASNLKLITTGAGLQLLGEEFRFTTELQIDGNVTADSILHGNIYIVGGGDPSFGSSIHKSTIPDSIFNRWVQAINTAGIKQIAGKVIADEGYVFDNEYRHESWNWGDIGLGYGAGTSGLQFADNLCKLQLTPASKVGMPATISSIEPYIPDIAFENYTVTVSDKDKTSVSILSSPYAPRAIVTGVVSKQKATTLSAAIPSTSYVCAWHFNSYLNNNGITTSGTVESTNVFDSVQYAGRTTIDTYYSPILAELVSETNKSSNNCYAESILKAIGYYKGGVGSTTKGAEAIENMLREFKIDLKGIRQDDGSGLSRKNFVTTKFMCDFLTTMQQHPYFNQYEESLPVAGVDGTLKYMLKGTAGEQHVKAKSGSLMSVRGYSGYVTTKGNQQLCFSVIINNFTCPTSEVTKRLEKIMQLIAEIR